MPTFIQQIVGSLVRSAVLFIVGWFAAHYHVTFTEADVAQIVAVVTTLVATVGWSIVQKYFAQKKFLVAASTPSRISETEARARIPEAPSVLHPADVRPL